MVGFIKTNTKKVKQQVSAEAPKGKKPRPQYMKFPANRTASVRFLPPWTDEGECAEQPYKRIEQHWGVGAKSLRINCPKGMSGGKEPCFVCEQIELLKATGDPGDNQLVEDLRGSRRYVYQCIDRKDPLWHEEDPEVAEFPDCVGTPKIKIATVGWTIHKALTDLISNPKWAGFDDAMQGHDVDIKRVGSKKNDTEYSLMPDPEKTPIFSNPDGSPNMALIGIIGGYMMEDGTEVKGTLIDLDWMFKETPYISTLMIYHGFAPWEDEDKAAFGELVSGGQIVVPVGHQLEAPAGEGETDTALPPSPKPQIALPPAQRDPMAERFAQWRKRVESGQVIQDRTELIKQMHKEGQTELTESQLSEDSLWCYTTDVTPLDDGCIGCSVAHHCAKTFQKLNNIEWKDGQPMRPEYTGKTAPGKPSPGKQRPAQEPTPQAPASSMPMPPASPKEITPTNVNDMQSYLEENS